MSRGRRWQADDFYHPGFDYTRFRVKHWQRFERMLSYTRERDMVILVILDIADGKIHLNPGSEDERRYLRYATARLRQRKKRRIASTIKREPGSLGPPWTACGS